MRVSPPRRIKVTRSSPRPGDDEKAPKGKYSVITCWGRGSPVRPFQRADDRGMTRARPPEPRLLSLKVIARRDRLLQAPPSVLQPPLGLADAVLGRVRRPWQRFWCSRRGAAPPADQATQTRAH